MIKAGIKTNHKKGIAAANKARKREEAEARQAISNKRTLEQKISAARPGSSEHKRLMEMKRAGA